MYSLAKKLRPTKLSLTRFKEKLNELKMRAFVPKISFSIQYKNYLIKTADTFEEIKEMHLLRKEVFAKDYGILDRDFGVDFSREDLIADHVILIHQPTNQIIATYRMISSTFSREFYSQSEYEIDSLVNSRESKVELSRACVHPDFRNGAAITLIWRGLAKYVKESGARYLFGISSMPCPDPRLGALVNSQVSPDSRGNQFEINVKNKFKVPIFQGGFVCVAEDLSLPSLLQAYLSAGAKIYGEPAYDKDFNSIDFFTLLDTQHMNPRHHERYFESAP